MNVSAFPCLLLLFISLNGLADTKKRGRLSSGNALQPRCEPYTGTACGQYIKNVPIYVKPTQPQIPLERKIELLFNVLPNFLSVKCKRYAYHALCLIAFPPCDQTVNYTKPRQFCQEECKVLEQHICVNEFATGLQSMAGYVPSCSKLPAVGSDEHKKCLRLNVKVDQPVFRMELKNVTAGVGDMVVLKCKMESTNIPPRITWYKDGKIIQHGHPFYKIHLFRLSSRMKIRRVRLRDSGKFMCKISNVFWNVSSENWVTVVPSTKPSTVAPTTKPNTSSCGFLKRSSVCWKHLTARKVYFHNPQNQHELARRFQKEIENVHVSSQCSEYATAAMCYHLFPVCAKNHMKHRLCKTDCLKVKNKVCQKQLPSIFPHCSKLPKITGRKGRHCDKLTVLVNPTVTPRCGQYIGNNICEKYLQNKTVFLYDKQQQYHTEKIFAMSLKNNFASEECLKFGIPGMCYHLFPGCDRGMRKSRLCKEDCIKLKTEVCRTEVSLIKKVSVRTLETMFPECSSLPSAKSSNGRYCAKLGIKNGPIVSDKEDLLYDSNQKCYNETGLKYLGIHNISVFGKPCISWHIPAQSDSGWSHNFCRNPEGKLKGNSPWCYVNSQGRKEYCPVPKCGAVGALFDGEESTSLGRTIYVVIAIAAVLLLFCITIIVYWKVHDSKRNLGSSPQGSAAPFAKCSSIQLSDGKESTIKSFIMNEKMKRGKVKYTSVMGEGSFCKVFKGELVDDQGNFNMNIVIKGLSEDASDTEKDAFHRETSLLCPLQHVNILGLLGVSPSEDSVFVVFEYLSETNLHQFLKLKQNITHGICDEGEILAADVLLNIAEQIAIGMKYLAEFNYIHGDLAARNCFISENELNVKISMLGIGSHKYPSDYGWLHRGNSLFPIRWMSPESLESLVLTSENDVWAFGVLLWEIFSLGLKPYHQYSNTEVTDKVRALELLECSQNWPRSVTCVIRDCWEVSPSMRPSFETIYDTLSNLNVISIDTPVEVTV